MPVGAVAVADRSAGLAPAGSRLPGAARAGSRLLTLRGARLWDRPGVWTLVIRSGRILSISAGRARSESGTSLELGGLTVLPGFHDPHLHLLAMAREHEVARLPKTLRGRAALASALRGHARSTTPGSWLRIRGFDPETTLGGWSPDRHWLDRVVGDVPTRIQHRNLRLDLLNSSAVRRCGLTGEEPGVETDGHGAPTGRVFGAGHVVVERRATRDLVHIRRLVARTSRELLAHGITSIQDAGEGNGTAELDLLDELAADGTVRQRLWTMVSGEQLRAGSVTAAGRPRVVCAKLVATEARLDLDELTAQACHARRQGLGVAIHATTETELAAAVAAIQAARAADRAGPRAPAYRIEHAFVASDAHVEAVAETGATVVVTPRLIPDAGDGYLTRHSGSEVASLHRLAGWTRAGVPLALASDAPVTAAEPLAAIAAAMSRRTASGRAVGLDECLDRRAAILASTRTPARLAGVAPSLGRIAAGAAADLVAVQVDQDGTPRQVAMTILGGDVAHVGR